MRKRHEDTSSASVCCKTCLGTLPAQALITFRSIRVASTFVRDETRFGVVV
jgi:hypothetical protein